MEKNSEIAAQMNDFVSLFNRIEKTLSFNRQWLGEKGTLAGVVTDENHRLIMEHGELARTTDQYKRKVILIGTHFGLVAVYPTMIQPSRSGLPTLSYYMTESLASAFGLYAGSGTALPVTAKLVDHLDFPVLDTEALLKLVGEIAEYYQERHMYVGDGMKKAKAKRTFHKKPAQAKKPEAATNKTNNQPKKHGKPKPNKQKQVSKTKPAETQEIGIMEFGTTTVTPEDLTPPAAASMETAKFDDAAALAA